MLNIIQKVTDMYYMHLQGRQQVQAGGAAARRRPQDLTDAGVAAGGRRPRAPLQGLCPLPLPQPAGTWDTSNSNQTYFAGGCSVEDL